MRTQNKSVNKTILGNIKVYDKNAEAYNENCDTQYAAGKKTIENAIQKACEIVKKKKLKQLRVLDAGCGNGRTTINLYVELRKALIKMFIDVDITVVGMDISSKILELAAANAELEGITSRKVVFYNKSIEKLSEEDGYFDLIFSNFALHLCTPNVYKRFFARLNKGGAIVINQGGKNNCKNLYDMAFAITKEDEFSPYFTDFKLPVFYPTKEEVAIILYAAGFTDIAVIDDEHKDFNYENMIETFVYASMLLFKEQLPSNELKNLFEKKYRELSKRQPEKYKHVHRLHITANKA